jgi:hypothetical protein
VSKYKIITALTSLWMKPLSWTSSMASSISIYKTVIAVLRLPIAARQSLCYSYLPNTSWLWLSCYLRERQWVIMRNIPKRSITIKFYSVFFTKSYTLHTWFRPKQIYKATTYLTFERFQHSILKYENAFAFIFLFNFECDILGKVFIMCFINIA